MRGIQNNFTNFQINQFAMEQAAIQAAKDQQSVRARAQTAEEILKQQDENDPARKKSAAASQTNPDGQQKSNPQNFKNLLYSKEGVLKKDSSETIPENTAPPQTIHIDFKV